MIIKVYSIALTVFFLIDMIWLGFVAKNFYAKHIGFLLKADVNWIAAIMFYLLFILGVVIFVITPAIDKRSWVNALMYGALFGLVTYATYDLTNLATVKNWPLIVTIVDLAWGTILSASVSIITYLVVVKFDLV